jgi:putative phage-type endonuclease
MSDIGQGSPEWIAARLGKATASRVADIIATTKSGWGASRANYAAELIVERLTGIPAEQYISPAMKWGIETEQEARAAYSFYADTDVGLVGFDQHPTIPMAGASPDGLVGKVGLVEFKCPNTATHIDTLLGEPIASKYIVQIQWQMACRPERRWCDWVSYDPRLPEAMRMFVQRVKRDDAMIADLENKVREFLTGIDQKLAALNKRFSSKIAA